MMKTSAEARPARNILALMCGTSVDSIDAAICRVENRDGRLSSELLAFTEYAVPADLRQRIFEVFADGNNSLSLTCSLNFEIAQAFAHAAMAVARQWEGELDQIDAIASHGQTLYHIAPHMAESDEGHRAGWVPSTLQAGEGAVIAALTGRPVISNFRVADMAVGGNGAPLVPFADYHLLSESGRGVVVHNLGGIGNCTWLPPSGSAREVVAFDTGPANMIIDGLVSHFYSQAYDADGQYASRGKVIPAVLQNWMDIPYISASPPKSTGRELFGRQFVDQVLATYSDHAADDLIATATEFIALSLVENLRRYITPRGKIDRLILAGGGAQNPFLVQRISSLWTQRGTPATEVTTLDNLGLNITSKSRECVGFALLGYAHLERIPGNMPSVTGARCSVILGDYTPAVGLPC